MATTYQLADEDVAGLVAARIAAAEPDLSDCGALVGVLMALNPSDAAVKHNGYPAAACVKVVALKDRVTKGYDAELLIDERVWGELRPRQREALVAHELRHLQVVPRSAKELADNPGAPRWKTDDLGRPRLRTVKADWQVGDGFKAIVAEFGEWAIEYETIARAKAFADGARAEGEKGRAA